MVSGKISATRKFTVNYKYSTVAQSEMKQYQQHTGLSTSDLGSCITKKHMDIDCDTHPTDSISSTRTPRAKHRLPKPEVTNRVYTFHFRINFNTQGRTPSRLRIQFSMMCYDTNTPSAEHNLNVSCLKVRHPTAHRYLTNLFPETPPVTT